MAEVPNTPIWESWESILHKSTALGQGISRDLIEKNTHLDGIAVVPRGGLYVVNILARQLGLSGDQVFSLGISKYDREHPTQAGEFKVGQLPLQEDIEGKTILLADEVSDTGETTKRAHGILLNDLGAATVLTAAIHYKPGENVTGIAPDYYVEETNGWVHYPWEGIDPVGSMHQMILNNGTATLGPTDKL